MCTVYVGHCMGHIDTKHVLHHLERWAKYKDLSPKDKEFEVQIHQGVVKAGTVTIRRQKCQSHNKGSHNRDANDK